MEQNAKPAVSNAAEDEAKKQRLIKRCVLIVLVGSIAVGGVFYMGQAVSSVLMQDQTNVKIDPSNPPALGSTPNP